MALDGNPEENTEVMKEWSVELQASTPAPVEELAERLIDYFADRGPAVSLERERAQRGLSGGLDPPFQGLPRTLRCPGAGRRRRGSRAAPRAGECAGAAWARGGRPGARREQAARVRAGQRRELPGADRPAQVGSGVAALRSGPFHAVVEASARQARTGEALGGSTRQTTFGRVGPRVSGNGAGGRRARPSYHSLRPRLRLVSLWASP